MNNSQMKTRFSALTAVLFTAMAFATIVPAPASATDVGGGVDITLQAEGAPIAAPIWMNSLDATKRVKLTVTHTVGAPNVNAVSFAISETSNGEASDVLSFADAGTNQAGWSFVTSDDPSGSGDTDTNVDSVGWESPAPSLTCTLSGTGCPDMTATGTFEVDVSPVAGAVDFAAVRFHASAVGDAYSSTEDANFMMGLDRAQPTLTCTFSDGGSDPESDDASVYHSEAGLALSCTATDATSGLATFTLTGPGTDPACIFAPGTTTATICNANMADLADGANSFTATAQDVAGNNAFVSNVNVLVDRTGPTTTIATVSGTVGDNGWFTAVPTVSISASDGTGDVAGVDEISWAWTGATSTPDGTGSDPGAPAEGISILTASATDLAHSANTGADDSLGIKVDTIDPLVSLVFDDSTANTDTSLFHSESAATPGVTFTFSDTGSGIASQTFKLNNVAQTCAASPCTIDMAFLSEGVNTVTASATDAAGNLATATALTIKIDRTGPTTTIATTGGTVGSNGWFTAVPTVSISASDGTGDVAGVDEISWAWTGATSTPAGTGSDPGAPAEGISTLTASATDLAHSANTGADDSLEIKVDTAAPTSLATLVTASPAGPAPSVDIDFTCTASDATSDVASVALYYATGATAPALLEDYATSGIGDLTCDDTFENTFSATVTGTYHFVTLATDNAGNVEAFEIGSVQSILVDLTAPSASIALDALQAVAGSATVVDLEVSAGDADTDLASILIETKTGAGPWQTITEDPAYNVVTGGAQTVTVDLADFLLHPDGTYLFRVTATDEVGNTATTDGTLAYTLDTTVEGFSLADIPAFLGPGDLNSGDYTVSGTVEEGSDVTVTLNAGTPEDAIVTGAGWTADVTPGLNSAQTVEADATDGVGNLFGAGSGLTDSFRVDTLAPSVGSSVPTGLTVAGLGTVTFTVTDDVGGSGPDLAVSDVDISGAAGAVVAINGDSYEVDLSAITTDGTYTVVVNAKDDVGNAATQVTWTVTLAAASVTTPAITTSSPTFTYLAVNSNGPHTIEGTVAEGWTITGFSRSSGVATGTGTACALVASGDETAFTGDLSDGDWSLALSGLTLTGAAAARECAYTLTVTAEDVFGNPQSDTLTIRRLPVKTVDVAMAASDSFHSVGGVVNLMVTVTEDGTATAQPNVRVRFYSDAGTIGELDAADTFLNVRTTSSLGQATLPVGTTISSSGSYDFLAVPTEQLVSGVGFRPVVQDALGLETVIFTRLVPDGSLTADADAYLRNTEATFTQALKWEHDDSPATGLSTVGGVVYPQVAGNSLQLAIDGVSDTLVGSLTETATDGEYTASYTSATAQILDFLATGSAIAYKGDASDAASTFALASQPTLADLPWVSVATQVTLTNLDDATDSTGGFVDEDDTVRVAVSLVATPGAVTVTVPSISLRDNFGTTNDVIASCNDGDVCDTASASGVVGFDIDADAIPGYFASSDTQIFTAFPDAFTVGSTVISPDLASAADRADFGAQEKITFTGVDVAIDGTLTADFLGAEDFDADRIWADADDFVPGGLGTNSDVDEVTIPVVATWRHDTLDAASALLRLVDGDGDAVLDDAAAEITATTNAFGEASFTLDPDNFGGLAGTIDYLVNEFQVELVSVPEPLEAGHSDPTESITFQDAAMMPGLEAVWTRVILDVELNEADEVYLRDGVPTQRIGDELTLDVTPRYLLDVDGTPGYDVVEGDTIFSISLTDTVAAEPAIMLTKQNENEVVPMGGLTTFNLARGCTDASDLLLCEGSRSVNEAGFHNFEASASDIPHGLTLNLGDYDTDLLWTGIALDATTDRVTQAVNEAIEYSVRAYYAHGYDADGAAIALADRIYPNDVQFTFNGATRTVEADAAYTEAISQNVAGSSSEQAVCIEIAGGAADDCVVKLAGTTDADYIDVVASSATLTRQWLDFDLEYANSGTDDFLEMSDRLVLRGSTPTIAFKARVLYDLSTLVSDLYSGHTFFTSDNAPASQMPDRTHAADPYPLAGQTPFTVEFYDGTTLVATAAAPTYDGTDSRWEVAVPAAATAAITDNEGLEVRITASLRVTDDDATTVGDAASGSDGLVVTAVDLALDGTSPVEEDGALWLNLGVDATIDVTATWAHDGSAVTSATFADVFGVDTPLVASDGLTLDDGEYTITLPSTGTSEEVTFQVVATAGTSLLDDGMTTKPFGDATGLVLTRNDVEQDAIFTRLVFSTSESNKVLNVNDVAELSFDLAWEHDDSIPAFANVEFAVDTGYGPMTQAGDYTSTDGGFVVLSSGISQVEELATPAVVLAEHSITAIRSIGPMPELTWTQLVVGTIALDPAPSGGDGVTDATAFEYAVSDVVGFTVPVSFEGLATPATGVTAAFLGYLVADDDDGTEDGSIEQAVSSGVAQTIPVDVQPIEAMLGGTQITSSTGGAVVWLDFS